MSTLTEPKYLQTIHTPTNKKVHFRIVPDTAVVGVVTRQLTKRDELVAKLQKKREQDADPAVLAQLYQKGIAQRNKSLAVMLEPEEEVPADYETLQDYIDDCLFDDEAYRQVVDFFYTLLPDATSSQGDGAYRSTGIQFLDELPQ